MKYYPICLDISNKLCVVVGGGNVALRKIKNLLKCNAKVSVVAPDVIPQVKNLSKSGRIKLILRKFKKSDINKAFLVISATSDKLINAEVYKIAKQKGILVNVVDLPEFCNFILPAVVRRGDLTIAVSTSGSSPAYAVKIKKELELKYGPEYAVMLEKLKNSRKKILSEVKSQVSRKKILKELWKKL
ncbi:MAG: bifunctional precorrin-2 dehydrogenase/sirohydrochlorin ferrochelatase [Candidatus Firestonebacteria bacterium]